MPDPSMKLPELHHVKIIHQIYQYQGAVSGAARANPASANSASDNPTSADLASGNPARDTPASANSARAAAARFKPAAATATARNVTSPEATTAGNFYKLDY